MKKCVSLLVTFCLLTLTHCLFAQGTAFTYQGNLSSNAVPANGFFDFEFSLYPNAEGTGTQVGSTITQTNIGVTNGLFITPLDFGDVFTGNDTWLAISVRSDGVGSYTPLTPLQELTPEPYAIFATMASNAVLAAQLSGSVTLAQLPGAVVTNNATNVAFANLTLSSNLTLPSVANINSGGNSLLHSDGNNNFYAGPGAGTPTNSGGFNTGIGAGTLQNNINGTNNTAVGFLALANNTNGAYNTASGTRALYANTSGSDNTAYGRQALLSNTNGNDNTAIGHQALSFLTGGSYNIVLGTGAGINYGGNATSNILIGNPGVGGDNNAIRIGNGQTAAFIAGVINGDGSGLTNLSASKLASGIVPLAQLPAAVVTNNEANASLGNLTLGGSLNLPAPAAISSGGSSLLYADNSSDFFAGEFAGNPHLTGGNNTAEGDEALSSVTSGAYNTANGTSALHANSTGDANTADGYLALENNKTGNNNTADGADTMAFNISGSYNTAIGTSALENSTNDSELVAIGYQALQNDNALFVENFGPGTVSGFGENTAIGWNSLQADTFGYANTAVGNSTLEFNTTGYGNTAVGDRTLFSLNNGAQNVAVGYEALFSIHDGSSNNIAVGYEAGVNMDSGSSNIYIGNSGISAESGVIRIGESQSQTYLVGTVNCGTIFGGTILGTGIISSAGIDAGGAITAGGSITTLGNMTCCSLTVAGGCDLAEPFPISTAEQQVSEGAVMVIDEEHAGQLKLANQPYDTRVAGVVSGANGINPGIQMQQQGLIEGGRNVALTGRVYVQADASNGAIEPGDLLTTSRIPGRAMKVTDHIRAQGAILGKAMSGLSEGKGMVLVLVTLQ